MNEEPHSSRATIDQIAALTHALLFLFSPLLWALYDPSLLLLIALAFTPVGAAFVGSELVVIWLISIGRRWAFLAASGLLLAWALFVLTITGWSLPPIVYLGPMILPALLYSLIRLFQTRLGGRR